MEPPAPENTEVVPVRNSASTASEKVKRVRPTLRKKNTIPDEILNDVALNNAIKMLPSNYNFEIHKSIWKIRQIHQEKLEKKDVVITNDQQRVLVGLQFPEGLQMFACVIADILTHFSSPNTRVIVLGDVTYGACCIDDFTARKLGCDLLVHYGHSCLVPVNVTSSVKVLYVFVEIKFDSSHLVECIKRNFDTSSRLACAGTIQFASAVQEAVLTLSSSTYGYTNLFIPQSKPLSPGETLGCTAPTLPGGTRSSSMSSSPSSSTAGTESGSTSAPAGTDAAPSSVSASCSSSPFGSAPVDGIVFVADGRFHLEAMMIANPLIPAYRYDPYSKVLTREIYETEEMKTQRLEAIKKTQTPSCKTFGLILGTLGRQGSIDIFHHIRSLLRKHNKHIIPFLMAEISPQKIASIKGVDAWIQIACPRLSVDWGQGFQLPMLSPYELHVALREVEWRETYPMDFYSQGGGPWGNMYHRQTPQQKQQQQQLQQVASPSGDGGDNSLVLPPPPPPPSAVATAPCGGDATAGGDAGAPSSGCGCGKAVSSCSS